MTGRGLLEINQNVTIFQWLLPYRVFIRVSLPFPTRPKCLSPSFSFSLYTAYRDTCERIETRKQRVVACAGCWKKRSEISTEGGAAVMYIQGMKRIAGVVIKKRRLCGEPAKGRNEPSLAARQDRPAYCVFWDWFERGNLKREGQHLLIPLLRFPLTDDVY